MWPLFSNFNLFFSILQIASGNTHSLICNSPDLSGNTMNLRETPQTAIVSCKTREQSDQRVPYRALGEQVSLGLTLIVIR
ncbi:hypothetical protein A6X21_10200 [Planctopirus hydrillae]|uniref:Uncharacterized protein n=1 Tax=Planctopirus hydrillae TaxID=1841610 RepID=A0A1C3E753_9PLAN|nr:hypothetical protein A6X21_10200 [Planctopirus hydrillae]